MRKRALRWLVLLTTGLLLSVGALLGGTTPPVAHGADPTPTPTTLPDPNDPGGHGGGGY